MSGEGREHCEGQSRMRLLVGERKLDGAGTQTQQDKNWSHWTGTSTVVAPNKIKKSHLVQMQKLESIQKA